MTTETSVEYLGFVQTTDGRSPVLARAGNATAREDAKRENSGGVIFTEAQDMRSLEELLQAHEVAYAVLEAPWPAVDDIGDMHGLSPDWREEARDRLAFNLEIASEDDVMDEDYVFLAALSSDALDAFLERAYAALDKESTTEGDWGAFLEREAVVADESLAHRPLPAEKASPEPVSETGPVLLSLADLQIAFTGGAMGGPRPLAEAAES
jgi:hypothetical protein